MRIITTTDLPRRRSSHTRPLPAWVTEDPAARKRPRRVLVVDDEPLIRWAVAEALAARGLDIDQAGTAATALDAVLGGRRPYDMIVLDLRLPDMHDLSLLATIRQMSPAMPIIVMTAFGTDTIVERAIALGVRAVLAKPFPLERLIDAVDEAIR